MIRPFKESITIRNLEPDFIIVCFRNRRVITISNRLHPQDRHRIINKARSLHRDV